MNKELVIISGKGGTGKTSLSASFAVLAERAVIADCDVDAADLHLLLSPQVLERHEFRSGHQAVIRPEECILCGECLKHCRFDAVKQTSDAADCCEDCSVCMRSCLNRIRVEIQAMKVAGNDMDTMRFMIDPIACEGCGVCVHICPVGAIDFQECICGEWMISDTRCGPMVHARLGIAADNSGKLVSLVRKQAKLIAEKQDISRIIVDGPPGIGCPVIASLTGTSQVLIVTEPTVSGEHDLDRVLGLATHFKIPAAVCVNKWDLNPKMTTNIENKAKVAGAKVLGRIRYDSSVTKAQMEELTVVETGGPAAEDIKTIWKELDF